MATSAEQFGKSLIASGLMTADEVKTFWTAIAAGERPKDGEAFAQKLVAAGKLTDFQAREIFAGRGGSLVMGDYEIVGEIGAGGMGKVYKARHRRMKRVVALKVMSQAAMADEAAVKRFQREVEAAARLEHPNIVTAYDAGRAGAINFLVMQFVDGGDLASLVIREGRLSIERAANYVGQAARGLAFAHGEGVIHRDIKPANLLLDKKGVVKILDMGLARFDDGGDGLTATEQVMGTVDYMSPEQAADTKHADGRADIYSLGCTLWYLLTAKKLYDGDTMIARLMAHRDGPLPSLMKIRDDAPWALEQVLNRMVAKRAADRYQTMDEVVAALEPFAGDSSGTSSSTGKGSSTSGGPSGTVDKDLATFFRGMSKTGGGPSPTKGGSLTPVPTLPKSESSKPDPSKTAPLEATEAFSAPDLGTDPKSQVSLAPLPAAGGKAAASRRVRQAKPRPTKFIAAGTCVAAAAIGLVVWSLDRNSASTNPGEPFTGADQSAAATFPSESSGTGSTNSRAADYALDFDGDGDVVAVPNLKFNNLTEPLTVEAWVRPRNFSTSTRMAASVGGRFYLQAGYRTSSRDVRWQWGAALAAKDAYDVLGAEAPKMPAARAIHLAGVFDGREVRFYVDGKRQPASNSPPSRTFDAQGRLELGNPWPGTGVFLGAQVGTQGLQSVFDGTLDEIRFSRTARYTGDFEPDARFEPDEQTAALFHCDEGSGNVLVDSSGKENHGEITGARWVPVEGSLPTAPPAVLTNEIDLLPLADAARDALVFNVATNKWEPGGWVRDGASWLGGLGRWQLLRLPRPASAPAYTLELDFEIVNGKDGLLIVLPLGDVDCYLEVNGHPTGGTAIAGFGEIDKKDENSNETTVTHPAIPTGTPQQLRIDVDRTGDDVSLTATLNGRRLTQFQGKAPRLRVNPRFKAFADGAFATFSVGSVSTQYRFRRALLTEYPVGRPKNTASVEPTSTNVAVAPIVPPASGSGFALDFSARTHPGVARVTIPPVLNPSRPFTVEMYVTPRSTSAEDRQVFIVVPGVAIKHFGTKWDYSGQRGSNANYNRIEAKNTIQPDRRTHLAGTYDGKEIRLFIDGKAAGVTPLVGTLPSKSESMGLGGHSLDLPAWGPFDGTMDEFRISTIVRYESTFQPPTEFTADQDTLILYRFDEGAGDRLSDASGRGHHGKIIGAVWVR